LNWSTPGGEEKLEEEFKNGEDFTLTPESSSRKGTIYSISINTYNIPCKNIFYYNDMKEKVYAYYCW